MSYIIKKWEVDAIGKLVELTTEMGRLSGENEALKKENAFLKELLLKQETTKEKERIEWYEQPAGPSS